MAYSQTWLEDTTRARGLLVVATVYNVTAAQEQTLYFSSMGFNTLNGTVFNPVITGDLKITESISIDGSVSITYGDVELRNPNGELDDYVDSDKYVWSNRNIKIYYGDPSWRVTSVSDLGSAGTETFELIYDGLVDDCKSRNRNVINLILRDKLENLNVPITERTIGTVTSWLGQTNQDTIQPLIFGEVFNITPVLVEPATLSYRFNTQGATAESVLEIRDNGFPIFNGQLTGATVSLSAGTFSLSVPAAGTITCSVQGVKTNYNVKTTSSIAATYVNTIPDIIRLLVTNYGTSGKQFSTAEIDNNNFKTVLDSFGTVTPACGFAVLDRVNLLQAVQELASSIGCQIYANRKGILRLLRLGATSSPVATIEDTDIIKGSLVISDKTQQVGAVKLAYCKNWTPQQNLATLIPDSSKTKMAEEWLIKTVTDSAALSLYKLTSDPPQKSTYLITTESAQQEAQRLLTYYKTQRTIFSFTATSKYIDLNLGDWITIKHNRFGLQSGKPGQIISISPQWRKGLVDLEVIV